MTERTLTVSMTADEFLAYQQAVAAQTAPPLRKIYEAYANHARASLKIWPQIDSMLRRWVLPAFGDRPASELTGFAWAALAADMVEAELSPATINKSHRQVSAMLSWAVAARLLPSSPLSGAKYLTETTKHDVVLTHDEIGQVLALADAEMAVAVLLGYDCGMRLGEVTGLRWDQVDLQRGRITVMGTDTKTGAGRVVPLTERAVASLRALQGTQDAPGWVFSGGAGVDSHLDQHTLWWRFRRLLRNAGLEVVRGQRVRYHDLRHSFASNALRSGVAEAHVRMVGGWRDPHSMARYLHPGDEDLDIAQEAMNRGVKGKEAAGLRRDGHTPKKVRAR